MLTLSFAMTSLNDSWLSIGLCTALFSRLCQLSSKQSHKIIYVNTLKIDSLEVVKLLESSLKTRLYQIFKTLSFVVEILSWEDTYQVSLSDSS